MVQETWVQSQVASYRRLLKWYLIPPCLTLSNIRYVSRGEWSKPAKGVAPSPTPRYSSYWKGSLLVALDNGRQLYFIYIFIYSQICFVLSELISVARQYLPVTGIETRLTQTPSQKPLTIQPRGAISSEVNFKRLWITITIVYIHPFNGCRELNSSTKRLAMNANGNTITSSPENSTLRG